MVLLNLFLPFLREGLLAIGGAFSFLPLIEKEELESNNWLTKEEFLEILGTSAIFPGAISIKYATYTGNKMAGILGAIVANLGNILAPVLFIVFASVFYTKYKETPGMKGAFGMIQLVMFAMIISVAFQVINIHQLTHPRNIFIVVIAILRFLYTKIHPAAIILCAGILGAFLK